MSSLVWLASYPKSGNTWVRAFSHNLLHDKGGTLELNDLPKSIKSDAARAEFERQADMPLENLGNAGTAALRGPVQRAMAMAARGAQLVKTHSALTRIGGHPSHAVDVTAAAIYLVRDPRDVALSYADHLGTGIDRMIDIMATEHAQTELTETHVTEFPGSWSQNVATWTADGNDSVHVVRYEDMHDDPQRYFGAIADFLNLSPDPAVFHRAVANTSFHRLRRQEKKTGFVERSHLQELFFRSGRVGDWRQVLTDEQAKRIVADHGEQMRRFGYLVDGDGG